MPIIRGMTLDQWQTRLDAYLEAERRVLDNQAYEVAGRRLTRANLAEIREGINECRAEIKALGTYNRRRFGTVSHGW
jgi:hypothetical protein